jgi:hypothetical protein
MCLVKYSASGFVIRVPAKCSPYSSDLLFDVADFVRARKWTLIGCEHCPEADRLLDAIIAASSKVRDDGTDQCHRDARGHGDPEDPDIAQDRRLRKHGPWGWITEPK